MPDESIPADLLACPRCDAAPLSEKDDGFRCKGCKTVFPAVGGIPWLFADPSYCLGEWRNRLHFSLQKLAGEAQRIRSALDDEHLTPLTGERLQSQADAIEAYRQSLRELLAPLDMQSMQASVESHIALRTRLPADQGINTYAANVHRDWSWGEQENQASVDEISAVLQANGESPAPLGDTLVLGAGAGRLAYDIHSQLPVSRTVAMDFNPLLLFIARQVTAGESLELHEFPLAPRTVRDFALPRMLAAPAPVRDGFHLVFGDARRPPFGKATFDSVVTPWLIDVFDDDLPVLAARINRLLNPGGRWINFGSLAFEHPRPERRYSAEEVATIVERSGFAEPRVRNNEIPYLCSPASRHVRRELAFTFCAERESEVAAPARHKALPDWLVTGKAAVPLTRSFQSQALSTRIHAFIMSLIDGKRTIADMSRILEEQKLMTAKEAEPAIRNFLTRMYDDSQRADR